MRRAESEIDPVEIRRAHERYATERDALLPSSWRGPYAKWGRGWHPGRGQVPPRPLRLVPRRRRRPGGTLGVRGVDDPARRSGDPARRSGDPACCGDRLRYQLHPSLGRLRGGPTIERLNTITRLGAGVDQTRLLAPEAIERTLAALRRYKAVIDRHGVVKVRMTATSAARDALNRDAFFAAAREIVGVLPELLAGDEEGRLSFDGATAGLDPATAPWLVVDIGGGSTELVWGPAPGGGRAAVRSLDVGCVRLTERFLVSDPPTASEMAQAAASCPRS